MAHLKLILLLGIFGSIQYVNGQSEKFSLSVGMQFSKNGNHYVESLSQSNIESKKGTVLIPRLTYRLDKHWAVGVLYSYSTYTTTSLLELMIPSTPHHETHKLSFHIKETQKLYGLLVQNYVVDQDKFRVFFEWDGKMGNFNPRFIFPAEINLHQDWSNDIKHYSSGVHVGARYNFYKGLGVELRINNLALYQKTNTNDVDKYSSFTLFDNLLGSAGFGLSFSF